MPSTGKAQFHWADYLVLGIYLILLTLTGIVFGIRGRKNKTSKEFLMGGADMHYIPVAMSMQASFLSAIFVVSMPAEVYNFGLVFSYQAISNVFALPICAYMILPVFHKMQLTSVYEYLEVRFSPAVRVAASIVFVLMLLLYLSVCLYTPALVVEQVTPLRIEISIVVCGAVCIIYTVVGGMKATVWNDFFQMIVVVICFILLIVFGHVKAGHPSRVFEIARNGSRVNFNTFHADPTIRLTFWTQTIGGTITHVIMYGSSQSVIQKFLSIKDIRNAQKSLWIATVSMVIFYICVCWIGVLMYAVYHDCDPFTQDPGMRNDQLVPKFAMDVVGHLPGIPGLFIAATFSAALSSVSGSINALSAVFLVDFIRPAHRLRTGREVDEKAANIITRCLATSFGLVTVGLGFAAKYLGNLVLQIALSIFGIMGGPVLGVLLLGMWTPFVNKWGAMAALLVSLGLTSWIGFGTIANPSPLPFLERRTDGCSAEPDNSTAGFTTDWPYTGSTEASTPRPVLGVYKISFMYYGLIALITCFIVGPLVSAATGCARRIPARLLFPWSDQCCCCCPAPCRKCCRCGSQPPQDVTDHQMIQTETPVDINAMEGKTNPAFAELLDTPSTYI